MDKLDYIAIGLLIFSFIQQIFIAYSVLGTLLASENIGVYKNPCSPAFTF